MQIPLNHKQKGQVLKYWQRLLSLPHEHVLKQSCNCLKNLHESGQSNWCTYICELLSENQFQESWESQSFENQTLGHFKEKLHSIYMEKCMKEIQNSDILPKLRTYKTYKNYFKQEFYLSVIKDCRYTTSLVRFRISSHNLKIETGRYTRPKTEIYQ